MEPNKQKHKKNHVFIVTSDAADAKVNQFQVRPWLLWLIVVTVCVVIGVGFGYLLYQDQMKNAADQRIEEYKKIAENLEVQLNEQMEKKEEDAKAFEQEILKLEQEKEILSTTVQLSKSELEELTQRFDELYHPCLLPLTGAATIEEITEGEPKCIFHAGEGALVVATAGGMVTEIIQVPEEGYQVTIDHGNGYMTIYKNAEEPKVKQGEDVMQGATIFVVDRSSLKLEYQILKDGVLMNPMDIMEIDG